MRFPGTKQYNTEMTAFYSFYYPFIIAKKKYLQKPDKSLNSIVWAYKAKEPLSESQDENRVEKGLVCLMLPNTRNKQNTWYKRQERQYNGMGIHGF